MLQFDFIDKTGYTGPQYVRQNDEDAGYDIYAAENMTLRPSHMGYGPYLVPTNTIIGLPQGYCGQVLPRSSMGAKGIIIPNSPGLIDPGYRGEVKVILFNLTPHDYKIVIGDRIAQLLLVPFKKTLVSVGPIQGAGDKRGSGGFGSTGK